MSKNEKKWILILVGLLIVAVVILMVVNNNKKKDVGQVENKVEVNEEKYTTKLEDGTKINTSKEFNNSKRYKSLEIGNIQYTERDNMSVLLADVRNTGNTEHKAEIVKLTILGENGEVITEIKPVIGDVKPGETIKLNASITADVTNAKDFKIEALK